MIGPTVHDDGSRLSVHDDGSRLSVHAAGELLSYVYRPADVQHESPRPYLHPLRTLGGDVVTTFRPWDHVWHKGLAWSLPNVGPWNFWGGPTYVRDRGYQSLDNDGSQDHEAFRPLAVGSAPGSARDGVPDDGSVGVVEELAWRTPPVGDALVGDVVVREVRTLTVRIPADDAWVLTWRTEMTNVSEGALDLGSPTTNGRENAGYGGLFWRGPRSFTGGTVLAPGFAGDAEEVRGERFAWLGFTGHHDGYPSATGSTASTVLIVDSGANPGGAPQWFVRSEPFACLCPAPSFSTEIPFPPGGTLAFEYAVVVADGAAGTARAERLAALGTAALRP